MELSAELRGVQREFLRGAETVAAIRGVDLQVRSGELLAVMGPSGSGKSTLLHLLGGLDDPSRGQVLLAAGLGPAAAPGEAREMRDLRTLDEDQRARLRRTEIGFIFQSFQLLPTLTALENVALPLVLERCKEGPARARAREVLGELGLSHRESHVPDDLSGGERQRVAIGRALASRPWLLLADEPTGNLDSRHGAEILALLRREAHEHGRTVVLVTHDPRVEAVADRTVHLRDGELCDE